MEQLKGRRGSSAGQDAAAPACHTVDSLQPPHSDHEQLLVLCVRSSQMGTELIGRNILKTKWKCVEFAVAEKVSELTMQAGLRAAYHVYFYCI